MRPGRRRFPPIPRSSPTRHISTRHEGSIALVEVATGRELARIDDPDGATTARIVFSPDGTQLIAILADQPHIRIWDLRAVRHRLAELDLDWSPLPPGDRPPPPAPDFDASDRHRCIEWIGVSSIDGSGWHPIRRPRASDSRCGRAVETRAGPGRGSRLAGGVCCNALAWELVAGAKADRDPQRAVPLAAGRSRWLRRVTSSSIPSAWPSIAPAGTPRQSPCSSSRSPRTTISSVPYDLLFLAFCHAKQGDARQSRACFDRAVAWLNSNSNLLAPANEELRAFRAEAEALLLATFGELPDDVFAKVPEARAK